MLSVCRKINCKFTLISVSAPTKRACRVTFSGVVLKEFLNLFRVLFRYFAENYSILEVVDLIKFSKIFQLHCPIKFVYVIIHLISHNIILKAGVKVMRKKNISLFWRDVKGIVPSYLIVIWNCTLSAQQVI